MPVETLRQSMWRGIAQLRGNLLDVRAWLLQPVRRSKQPRPAQHTMYGWEASLLDLSFHGAGRAAEAPRHISHRGHTVARRHAGSHDVSRLRWCPHSPYASQRNLLVAYVRVAQQVVQPLAEIIASGNDHVRDDTSHREVHDFLYDIRPERQIDAYRHCCRASPECGEGAQDCAILGICDFQKNSGGLSARHALAKACGTCDEVQGYRGGKGAADRLPVALVREKREERVHLTIAFRRGASSFPLSHEHKSESIDGHRRIVSLADQQAS